MSASVEQSRRRRSTRSANSTAVAGSDYSCPVADAVTAGTLTYAPGETTKTVRIDIIDDPTPEPAETFAFNLTNPTNATITRVTSHITIAASD